MSKRFIKYFLTYMAIAIVLTATGCPDQGKTVKDNTVKDNTVNDNTNPNINKVADPLVATSYFEWGWCPFECFGVCQEDPCGPPPPPTPAVPDSPKVCNEENIVAWLKKDMTIEKSIKDGDLVVEFDQENNTLYLKGKIHGATGSIRKLHFLLRHFKGRNPHIKTGDPCILKIRYSGK